MLILFFGCSVGGRVIVVLYFGVWVYIYWERWWNKEFLCLIVVLIVVMGLECEVVFLRSGFICILWVDWWDVVKKIFCDVFFFFVICVCENKFWNKCIENFWCGGWFLLFRGEYFLGLFLIVIFIWSFFLL